MVVMPRQLLDDLSRQQLRSIVAHELAHYARRDHWANAFALLVKALMWWNPVVWWAHREVRAAQELCCDAIAIDRTNANRQCYATTLLAALDFVQAEPFAFRELALPIGSRASILRRFEMIGNAQLSYRLSRWTLLMLLALAVPLVCFPVRSQGQGTPAVNPPKASDAGVAAVSFDTQNEEIGEAVGKELPAVNRPDRLFLVGIVWQREPSDAESTPTAWVFDRDRSKRTVLGKGAALRVGDTLATVENIEKDAVLLKLNEKLRRWKLGMSFAALLDEETGPHRLAEDEAGEAPAKEKTANGNRLRSAVQIELLEDPELIILRGNKEDVKRVSELIGRLESRRPESIPGKDDEEAGEAQRLEAYPLNELDPQTVLSVLQTLLAGRPPDAKMALTVDPRTGNLIVLASPNDHATVRATLEQMRPQAPETPKPGAKRPQQTGAEAEDGRKLRFAFRYQRWDDVLEWFAERAGLSLVADRSVPGTFNYTDTREFTVTESMDLLNSVLLTRGFTLVRRGRMLMVVNVADGIPPDLVPRVTMEDLDERGDFEYVSVMFPLGRRDAEKVRTEIRPLLGAFGSAVVLPQTHQMLVTERGGLMRGIGAVIQSIPEPEPVDRSR